MINVYLWIHRKRTIASSYKRGFNVEIIRYFQAIVCIETSKFDCEVEFPVAIITMNNSFTFVRATLLFHPRALLQSPQRSQLKGV